MTQYQVSDSAGAGHLKQLPETQGNVISLDEDLSIGPLKETKSFFKKVTRELFWKKIWSMQEEGYEIAVPSDAENFEQIKNILLNGDTINVWVSPNTKEELNFMKIVSEFPEFFSQIFYTQFEKLNSPSGLVYSISECPPGVVRKLYSNKTPLTEETANQIKDSWVKIVDGEGAIRIRQSFGNYLPKSEDYFDKFILSLCNANFIAVKNLIGLFLKKYPSSVPVEFIFYRIRSLINNGALIYRGNINSFRELEVRLN